MFWPVFARCSSYSYLLSSTLFPSNVFVQSRQREINNTAPVTLNTEQSLLSVNIWQSLRHRTITRQFQWFGSHYIAVMNPLVSICSNQVKKPLAFFHWSSCEQASKRRSSILGFKSPGTQVIFKSIPVHAITSEWLGRELLMLKQPLFAFGMIYHKSNVCQIQIVPENARL